LKENDNSNGEIKIFDEIVENDYCGEEADLSPLDSIWNKSSSQKEDQNAVRIFKATAVITNNQKNIPIVIYERPDPGSQKKGLLESNEPFQILQSGGLVAFIRSDQTKKGYWYKIVSQKFGIGSIFIDEEIVTNDKLKIL
jgi:hypothetical protein